MRPSEQIALVLSDLDLVNGIMSVNKAWVAGIDRYQAKTEKTGTGRPTLAAEIAARRLELGAVAQQ
jgi:hypothetical protein